MKTTVTNVLLGVIATLLLALLVQQLRTPDIVHAEEPPAIPRVLRAEQFELVDKQGKAVAQIHVGEDGGGNIRLRSADGTVRVKIGATETGSALLLFDTEAEPAVSMTSNGAGTLVTIAEKGKEKRIIRP